MVTERVENHTGLTYISKYICWWKVSIQKLMLWSLFLWPMINFFTSLQLQSLERAYEDMSLAGKREEERMKRTDPKKAQQAERLGMGLGIRT